MIRSKSAGFSLVELMIALVAGAFAVAAVYYLNGVSSRAFSEQMRVSDTQMSLRSAMEQLRRDFSRAGYLGTPSSALVPDCDGSKSTTGTIAPRWMRAISVTRDASMTGDVNTMLAPATNKTRADTVDVWGNYVTSDAYLADPERSTLTTIVFQETSEAFRRSFYDPVAGNGTATYNAARFAATFIAGRMIRIENEGRFFFRDIASSSSTAGAVSVTFGVALPYCFVGTSWSAVSPLVHLQYAVESDATADLSRMQSSATAAGTGLPGARRAMLVRREWRDDTATVVAGTARVVLDYAVEFAVDAMINTTASSTGRPAWAYQRSTTTATTNPDKFGSVLVTLTARSAEASPTLRTVARASFDVAGAFDSPMRMFQVIDPAATSLVLNARVRTLRSEIFLQNQ